MTETVPPSPVEVLGFAVSHEKAPDIEPSHQEKRNPFFPSISPVMFGPNISGYTSGLLFGSESDFVGAFLRQGESVNAKDPTGSWNHRYQTIGLDGSRVDSVFGKASTVQPAALRLLPYIKV